MRHSMGQWMQQCVNLQTNPLYIQNDHRVVSHVSSSHVAGKVSFKSSYNISHKYVTSQEMVQKSIRLVPPPASKQKVYYIVTSAFYEAKKKTNPQICSTVPAACQRFSSTHIEAKEQICSIKSTETAHKAGGVSDLPVTHRQTRLLTRRQRVMPSAVSLSISKATGWKIYIKFQTDANKSCSKSTSFHFIKTRLRQRNYVITWPSSV